MKLALDGIVSFSSFPLRVLGYLGFVMSFLGIAYLGYALIIRITSGTAPFGWTSTVVVILLTGGTQLVGHLSWA